MEKIIIKNFLIFDELEMPINKFNILIGPQASGKSLLAKLVYFFRKLFIDIPFQATNYQSISDLEYFIAQEFKSLFELDSTNNTESFEIIYYFSREIYIHVFFSGVLESKISDNLKSIIRSSIKDFESSGVRHENSLKWFSIKQAYVFDSIVDKLNLQELTVQYDELIFVPASRSFFSILESNSFILLADKKSVIDKLVQEFGRYLQYLKNTHHDIAIDSKIEFYFDKILKGKYQRINEQDYIQNDKAKVLLRQASSGQQEFFPLMLMLGSLFFEENGYKSNFVFIEEPEAHLFPEAQNQVVSAILYAMHATDSKFFITTHSPYILSALNNSIYAKELIRKGKLTQEEFTQMTEGAYPIDFADISAYSVQDGGITDIKDSDYMLIGGEILDSVSNEFGEVMDKLMALDV